MERLLLTGFEPFGPYSKNVAAELVDRLDGQILEISDGIRVQIVGLRLLIRFRDFREILREAVAEHQPKVAIGLGMDFKDQPKLALELLAHRSPQYGTEITDTEDQVGPNDDLDELDEKIRLPNEEKIKLAIAQIAGIDTSENAGRHMCETILRDLIRNSENGQQFQPAFIHVPHTADQLEESKALDEHTQHMPIEEQEAVLKKVLISICSFYLRAKSP